MARIDSVARLLGFTLIELLVTIAIVSILARVAYPSYVSYLARNSRASAQRELMELAAAQEKIYLNSSAYSSSVAGPYNGSATGGLGKNQATTSDANYALSVSVSSGSQGYTLTALPVPGTAVANDSPLTVMSTGQRNWGTQTW